MQIDLDLTSAVRDAVRAILPELRDELASAVRLATADRLVGVDEAAEILGTSPAAVRKRVERGTLKVVRHGRSIRVRVSDLVGLGSADR